MYVAHKQQHNNTTTKTKQELNKIEQRTRNDREEKTAPLKTSYTVLVIT